VYCGTRAAHFPPVMNNFYHLAVAWDWELDRDFIHVLEREIQSRKMHFYSISHHNTQETARKVHEGACYLGRFWTERTITNEEFRHLSRAVRKTTTYFINPPDAIVQANDKATMHLEFLTKGINVPFTIMFLHTISARKSS